VNRGDSTVRFLAGNPPSDVKGGFTRITGTFNQANDFGRYLMLLIIMGAALYPHLDRRWRRPLAVMLVAMSAFLVLTLTRSAVLATALGLLVVGLVQSKRLIAGLVVAAMATILLVPSFSSRLTTLVDTDPKHEIGAGPPRGGNTLAWRLSYWTEVLPLANSNPVTGIGLRMTQYKTDKAKQPHNDFIRTYVETGIIGLAAYIWLVVALVQLGRRAVRAAPGHTLDRGVAAGFLGCAVAFVAVSVVANVITNVINLWYLVAFAAAASSVVRRHSRPRPADAGHHDPPAWLSLSWERQVAALPASWRPPSPQ
jgi:putative inorganic carbon (HCO3(-)) transporter